MNVFAVNKKHNMLTKLKNAVRNARQAADELSSLDAKESKAQGEIDAAAKEGPLDDPKVAARINRASAMISGCRARRAALQSCVCPAITSLENLYDGMRNYWNTQCAERRELERASFLTACLPYWDNDEGLTANGLAGILPPRLARYARAGWNGPWHGARSDAELVSIVETFIGHIESKSAELGIPLE